ncbi:MAG: hypothetical protein ACO34E_11100 [Limisphaerales bacterium]
MSLFWFGDHQLGVTIVGQAEVTIGLTEHIGPVMERVTSAYLGLLEKNL